MRPDYQANKKNGLCITLYTKIPAEMLRNITTENLRPLVSPKNISPFQFLTEILYNRNLTHMQHLKRLNESI